MLNNQPKTLQQNRAIFGLGQKRGCAHEDLRELAFDVTNGRTDSIKELNFDEANGMILRLGGRVFTPQFGSKRTEQHHRQRAGISQIATAKHLKLMKDLAAKRNMTEDGLERLCRRMLDKPAPRTTSDTNKIIEAIKAMNKRDATFGAFNKDKKEAA